MIYAFVGKIGSGKDTAAEVLVKEYKMENIKFAGCLKDMLRAMLKYQGCPSDRIERMLEGDLKEISCDQYLAGRTPRYTMQTLGTEWGRVLIGPGVWMTSVGNRVESRPEETFVLSDLRFKNEGEMVKALGGKVIRIDRPGGPVASEHPSETEQAEVDADFTITNDGSLDQFRNDVEYIFGLEF